MQSIKQKSVSLFFFLLVFFIFACDDEIPDTPVTNRLTQPMRDASMPLESVEDYMVVAGTNTVMDMEPTMAGQTGGTQPSCMQGETRPLSGCGLERCLNGEWMTESNPRELCNGHDDDCDGQTDETFSIGGMCFANSMNSCRVEGTFICDPTSQTAVCMPSSMVSTSAEVCDGIDNDCDNMIDEGFDETSICCSNDNHCPPGIMCVDRLCDTQVATPMPPIDPNSPVGTCGHPIVLQGFSTYFHNVGSQEMFVLNCTGSPETDLILAGQSGLGKEVVYAFSVPETQMVRFTTELSLFDSIVYVFENNCDVNNSLASFCDESVAGLLNEPARPLDLVFEAQANMLYYVVLDGGNIDGIPFALTYGPGN